MDFKKITPPLEDRFFIITLPWQNTIFASFFELSYGIELFCHF